MKQIIFSTLIITAAISMTGCNRYYYKPNGVNVPLLTDAGQVHLDVMGSVSTETSNNSGNATSTMGVWDVQASGSPLKHLGLMANYTAYNFTTTVPDVPAGRVDARANLAEFGVGGYYAAGQRKVKMVVDLYGGAGFGGINSDIDMSVTRLFLQPGIGMRSPWFDVAFNPRIINLSYSNFNANGRDVIYLRDRGLIDAGGTRIDQRSYMFFEPTITMRAGYKFAKVQFQYVLSTPMSAMSWNHSPGRFSLGFYFTLEDLLSTIKEAPKE